MYDPEDQLGWDMIVQEIREFMEAESLCSVVNTDSSPTIIAHRLCSLGSPKVSKTGPGYLQLSEVIIVGNCYDQIRFSELSIDMYRMLQTCEHQMQDSLALNNATRNNKPYPGEVVENGVSAISNTESRTSNPHKYLLYKPTFFKFNTYAAAALKDLPANGIFLLYISADGLRSPYVKHDGECELTTFLSSSFMHHFIQCSV